MLIRVEHSSTPISEKANLQCVRWRAPVPCCLYSIRLRAAA